MNRPTRLLLASLTLVACAPGTDPTDTPSAGTEFLADNVITEAEQAAGAAAEAAGDETGVDHAEPTAETDGDMSVNVPVFDATQDPIDDGDGTSVVVDAVTGCTPARGYSHGNPFSICVVRVDGKLMEYRTAQAFTRMRAAAARSGVSISVVSGFRTMDQQRYLYNLYLSGRGNLAARPGYSNHQSGLALDLNTSGRGVYSWLSQHGAAYGFRRTVPSEIWHWERPAGSQGSASGGHSDGTCFSATLNRNVSEDVCVEARSDSRWYQCVNGTWRSGRNIHGNCSHQYPLGTAASPNPTRDTCYSSTLGSEQRRGSCVQSRVDRLWYQCASNGWIQDGSIASRRAGSVGACTAYHPL